MSKLSMDISRIEEAREKLRPYLKPTPLARNGWLSDRYQCEFFLKLETMQPIGSFKIRGATHKILTLSAQEKAQGVIACSAGNHGQGVAWASAKLGVSALIVMPLGASLVKVQNCQLMGAEVRQIGDNFMEAYEAAQKIAAETGRYFVHPFEDESVIAGQGTVGLEILESLPDVDVVIGSVGGGGLMAGTAIVLKTMRPEVRIIGCQAAGAASMVESVRQHKAVRLPVVRTFADGVAVSQASEMMRKLLEPVVDQWLTAEDEAIAAAVLTLLERVRIVAEGAGALPIAVLDQVGESLKGKKIVAVVSGGNIDVSLLGRIIDMGLVRTGRRLRVNVMLEDRPGSLSRLTKLLADQGANVIQAIHDRDRMTVGIGQTEVELTLETRGPKHAETIIEALKDFGKQVEIL